MRVLADHEVLFGRFDVGARDTVTPQMVRAQSRFRPDYVRVVDDVFLALDRDGDRMILDPPIRGTVDPCVRHRLSAREMIRSIPADLLYRQAVVHVAECSTEEMQALKDVEWSSR